MPSEVLTRHLLRQARHGHPSTRVSGNLLRRCGLNTLRHVSSSRHNTGWSMPNLLQPGLLEKPDTASTQIGAYRLRLAKTRVPSRHSFSVSTAGQATVVTANPRKDEDGNDMSIDITTRAANVSHFYPCDISLTACLLLLPAPKRNYVQRRKPKPRSPGHG